MGSAPIHDIADGHNERIKHLHWKLWYGVNEVLPTIDIRDKFMGPEVTIETEIFCAVVGNQSERIKAVRRSDATATMDFAIVSG
jgi:fatty acid synthase subunit alpha, fungi type